MAAVGYLVFFVVIILAGVVFAARQVYVVTLPAGVVTAVKHSVVAGIADIVEAMDHVVVATIADSVIAAFCDSVVFGEHDDFPTAFTKLFAAVAVVSIGMAEEVATVAASVVVARDGIAVAAIH